MAISYRDKAILQIAAIVDELPADTSISEYRIAFRKEGPQDVYSPEFRIFHEEANKRIKAIHAANQAAYRNNILFK